MHPVIVITEVGLLPAGERWPRLVKPLARELEASGLGRVLDYEVLERETDALGCCAAEEVAVELARLDYGRELVDGVLASAGLQSGSLVMPARWREYGCDNYFSGGWAERGHFDELSQVSVVVPLSEAYENVELEFLVIGRPGVDGIDFGYRKRHSGLWAYYPMRGEYRFMADTVGELVDGWCSGQLSV